MRRQTQISSIRDFTLVSIFADRGIRLCVSAIFVNTEKICGWPDEEILFAGDTATLTRFVACSLPLR